jgi:RNA polymerase sigma-70 factor (ECF subfamily)
MKATIMTPDFNALISAYSRPLFAYLWRMLGDQADAEDCLQDTFLRAFRGRARLNRHANPQAWLYRIATNTARTRLARRGRAAARTAPLDPERAGTGPGTDQQAIQSQLLAAVAKAVEALPQQQRAALILRKYQEQSYADIAAILDCTEAAARANVYQGIRRLRQVLAAEGWQTENELQEMQRPPS